MNKNLKLLCSEKDSDALQPLLDALRSKGISASKAGETVHKGDTVLAVISESFLADPALSGSLLDLLGSGQDNVLPLQLDTFRLPENLSNALYSRNIIYSAGREPELIAERIISALPKKKNRLPLILSIAGVMLLALIALIIWRSFKPSEPAVEEVASGPVFIPENLGLTEEDLAEVRCVVIIGEHFTWYDNTGRQRRPESNEWPDMLYQLASSRDDSENGIFDWYWHEDGSKVSMTSYDLSFLSYMPKLEELHMAKVRLENAPDLSSLNKFGIVWALDCELQDVDWLAASKVRKAQFRCDVDYTPLSRCTALNCAILDVFSDKYADFSAFTPPSLEELDLVCLNRGGADLSGLAGCKMLRRIRLSNVPVTDLSFLEGMQHVSELQLNHMDELRDISVLRGMNSLKELWINECRSIPDYSPISECKYLTHIHLEDRSSRLIDTSFLADHPKLTDIQIFADRMTDLNFLGSVGSKSTGITFYFAGSVLDYSGLSLVKNYKYLGLDPGEEVLGELFTYLDEAEISELSLSRFSNIDLSNMPRVGSILSLGRCGNTDLSTLPEDLRITNIELSDCSRLRSLEGIQKLSYFGYNNTGTLRIYNCPLLTDWSALNGLDLYSIDITGGFTIPSFEALNTTKLRLDGVSDINDLSFLRVLNNTRTHSFELVGLEGLHDLSPLKRFYGPYIAVEPQLADQAQELVESGYYEQYRIEYPDGGWQLDLSELELNSLDELNELPKSMLKRIRTLNIAGDKLFTRERYEIFEDWSKKDNNGMPLFSLLDRDTGELIPIGQGSISDISIFSELTGLEELNLYNQPLADLNGIQALSSLKRFTAKFCKDLSDVSALFTLQDLETIDLNSAPVTSLQGIQNLSALVKLNIDNTKITDLAPLAGCDFSNAYDHGGFDISMNQLDIVKDGLDALGTIRQFSNLAFTDQAPEVWMPLLKDSEIYHLGAAGDIRTDADLAVLAADHPELRDLYIGYSDNITDLTPLLTLKELEQVTINKDMIKAIKSLDGNEYGFELKIDG